VKKAEFHIIKTSRLRKTIIVTQKGTGYT
jgi:hypothetical protein